MSDKTFNVFLSYQWGSQENVKRLYDKLTANGLKVWMDIHQMQGGVNLHESLVEGIENSQYFVCCVTKKYAEAKNCENELCMAYDSNKKIIAVMFDDLPMSELNASGLILARLLRINVFDDSGFFEIDSPSAKFAELLDSLSKVISLSASNSSLSSASSQKQEKDHGLIAALKSDVTKGIHSVASGSTKVVKSPLKMLHKFY